MSTPKSRKNQPWIECVSCGCTFLSKDTEKHTSDCPPSADNVTHFHINNGALVGDLDIKKNDEIKGLSLNEIENLVFISQNAIQLCDLSIGEFVMIKAKDFPPIVKKVWPTVERSLTSVLLSKNVLDLNFGDVKTYPNVVVTKIINPTKEAKKISLILLGGSKLGNLNQVLISRLNFAYRGKLLCEGNKLSLFYFGKILKFIIKSIEGHIGNLEDQLENLTISDAIFFEVVEKTHWDLYSNHNEYEKHAINQNPLSRIGGLADEIRELEYIMQSTFNKNTELKNIKSTRSVLLFGSSGTGKSMLANALAKKCGANIVSINAADLYSKYSSNPEETIKILFNNAIENNPSVIVMDEVDLLCPQRSSRMTDSDKRIVSTLLKILDEIDDITDPKVFIIATTNKIDTIDPCFRRCGRFEREIEVPTPNPRSRKDILEKLLLDFSHNLDEMEVHEISMSTHGFVGADLVSLCSRAAMNSNQNNRDILEYNDIKFALGKVRPSAMREVQIEIPNVKWSDIGGQEKLKLILKQAVEWPLKYGDSFSRLGITPPKGVLMFGPPGCSKTMIARALATESRLNFLSIKGPELFSKWVGESERAVREVFRKARQVAPSIIFFDEIDALGSERSSGNSSSVQERVLAQLLTELDGVTPLENVTIVAATNRPDRIDKALLRPGRIDRIVYVPLPDFDTRKEILKIKLGKMPVQNVDIETLVCETENYSGAEVNALCHEAAMKALEETLDAQVVTMEHFEKALNIVTPRTPPSLIELYQNYTQYIT